MIEIKHKIRLSDPRGIVQKLREKEAVFLGAAKEKTIRIDNAENELKKRGLFLSVRGGFSNIIRLEEKSNSDLKSKNYLEIEIEDVDSMLYIFRRIGFSSIRIMEKYRTKWLYKQIPVIIDELPFGIFMKIEGGKDEVLVVKKELNLKKEEDIVDTYWEINEKNYPENKNIVFQMGYNLKLINM